ncbi:5'-methylthioadenosine/S-adenosylhomocysteine nucleosidase [Nocardiopsis rhodophaea]|uniref:5'-methylthioadenosine/S-adenosylhomocysteine nucleosidase family protein n=1 Tax=Nocardiopsis rhodophaea TaxID=280238 RepID=UPI0031DDE73E
MALGLTGKGNHPAAVLAERAIQQFSPDAVIFVGVAGALWDTASLGDVVMATQVYAYHGGTSEDDGLKARPRAWEAAHEISQIGSYLGRVDDWADPTGPGGRKPTVHFGPIAAGEIVQNSRISHEAMWIREKYNDALAIEMEAAGVAQAGHLSGSPVAIVRGISDRADGGKASTEDHAWQPVAAENAAAFAIRLAEELITDRERSAMHSGEFSRGGYTVNNYSSGQVGIQAGTASGGNYVFMGQDARGARTPDLATDLEEFRSELVRERSSGALDDATYMAADAELQLARKALEGNTPAEKKKGSVLSLKRLRGLIDGVPGLEAKVDGYIAAAQGMS